MKECLKCGKEIDDKDTYCYSCTIKKYGRFKCNNCGTRLHKPYVLCYECNEKRKEKDIKNKEFIEQGICINCKKKKVYNRRKGTIRAVCCGSCLKKIDIQNWARWKTYMEWGSARNLLCRGCGSKGKCEWHHEDYNDPLNPEKTIPLCRKCHMKTRVK